MIRVLRIAVQNSGRVAPIARLFSDAVERYLAFEAFAAAGAKRSLNPVQGRS